MLKFFFTSVVVERHKIRSYAGDVHADILFIKLNKLSISYYFMTVSAIKRIVSHPNAHIYISAYLTANQTFVGYTIANFVGCFVTIVSIVSMFHEIYKTKIK